VQAEAVNGEEALRRIRGESRQEFDPLQCVLLEAPPERLRELTGGSLGAGDGAHIISYEPNRLLIEANADKPAVLVVSESNYPGWVATVDGKKANILTANYLLRGVILPAGTHRVEMWYQAPAARSGALISALTLLFLVGALVKLKLRQPKKT
jgi:hypothetical protein